MAESLGDLFYTISAKLDTLERDMNDAERKVVKKVEEINQKAQVNPFGNLATNVAKSLAAMVPITAGLKGANVLLDTGAAYFALLTGNSEEWSRNITSAATGLEEMPYGIGASARELKVLADRFIGIGAETEKINKNTERMKEQIAKAAAEMPKLIAGFNGFESRTEKLRFDMNIQFLGADSIEAQIATIEAERRSAIEAITAKASEAGSLISEADLQEQIEGYKDFYGKRIFAAYRANEAEQRDRAQAERDALRESANEVAMARGRVKDIETQIVADGFRAQGREHEAYMTELERGHDRQIEMAQAAEEAAVEAARKAGGSKMEILLANAAAQEAAHEVRLRQLEKERGLANAKIAHQEEEATIATAQKSDLTAVEAETSAMRLEAVGRTMEARMVRLHESYRQQIERATAEGDTALTSALKRQEELAMALEAAEDANRRPGFQETTGMRLRDVGPGAGGAGKGATAQSTVNLSNGQRLEALLAEGNRLLAELKAKLGNSEPLR